MDFETLSKLESDIGQAQVDIIKLQAMLTLLVDYLTKYDSNIMEQRLWIAHDYAFQAPYAGIAADIARQIEESLSGAYQGFDALHKAYVASRKAAPPPTQNSLDGCIKEGNYIMTVKITLDRKTLDIVGVERIDDEAVTAKQIAAVIAPEIEKILQNKAAQVVSA